MIKYTYEEILELANDKGRFQWATYIIYRATVVFAALNTFSVTFLAGTNEFTCNFDKYLQLWPDASPMNVKEAAIPFKDGKFSECKRYKLDMAAAAAASVGDNNLTSNNNSFPKSMVVPLSDYLNKTQNREIESCSDYNYKEGPLDTSLAMGNNIVCDKKWLYTLVRSTYMIGFMLGCFVFGPVSDYLGRRRALLVVCSGMLLINVITIFTINFIYYIFTRLFLGFFSVGTFTIAWVYGGEVIGESRRVVLLFVGSCTWIVGMLVFSLMAFLLRQWFSLQIAISVFHLMLIPFYFVVSESPRWLYVKGRRQEADRLMRKIAKWNNAEPLPDNFYVNIQEKKTTKHYSIIDLLKTPNMRIKSLILFFTWLASSLVYYGLSMTTSRLPGDRYTNFLINSGVEPLSVILSILLCNYCGRRLAIRDYSRAAKDYLPVANDSIE